MEGGPGLSLFTGGVSLQLDTLAQQDREQEEQDREEARRIDEELAHKLQGAFDDLDMDDDDDSSLCSPPGAPARTAVTPGQSAGQLKYLTSTPYTAHQDMTSTPYTAHQDMTSTPYTAQYDPEPATPRYQQFQQLQVEETNFETPFVGRTAQGGQGDRLEEDVAGYNDQLNKSDSEKVFERKIAGTVGVTFKEDDLEVLYRARGREISRLEGEMEARRKEFEGDLRGLRHQLALASAEAMNKDSNSEQLGQVVSDLRRENKVLTQEIHQQNKKIEDLDTERNSLHKELEGNKHVLDQLQRQLVELQTADTVLRARQQHDATVRSLQERHSAEVGKLREEVDQATSRATQVEGENRSLATKLTSTLKELDGTVKAKVSEVTELHRQLQEVRARGDTRQVEGVKVRLEGELGLVTRQLGEEREGRRRAEQEVEQLRGELGAAEALAREQVGHSDSMVQLGLSGAGQGDNSGGSQRIREELHRSLVGNRTKREEISKLETSQVKLNNSLRVKEEELRQSLAREEQLVGKLESVKNEVAALQEEIKNSSKSKDDIRVLKKEVEELETQNIELKKHISEIVAGNDNDKHEAIEELREEYEGHMKEAVEETKQLMDGEVKRLRIELDVYSKTLQQVRNNQSIANEENNALIEKIRLLEESLHEKEEVLLDMRKNNEDKDEVIKNLKHGFHSEITEKNARELSLRVDETKRSVEKEVKEAKEKEFESRLEKVKTDLRAVWETEVVVRVEEGVARARLDWIKRLPEIEKVGGAARESLGELETVRQVVERERRGREEVEERLKNKEEELRRVGVRIRGMEKEAEEGRREGRREAEERLGQELREALVKQQEQWERIVRSSREETEEQRRKVGQQWEGQVEMLEGRLKVITEEKVRLEGRVREVEQTSERWKREVGERQKVVDRMKEAAMKKEETEGKKNSADLKLLREEAERRGEEVARQREEMAGMVNKWREEVGSIQATHAQERRELDEMRDKYRQLKGKVRRYQRHVENKEEHYKGEYARLEAEFRETLERLRGRMEAAYSSKEAQVELQLGEIRDQFRGELNRVRGEEMGDLQPVRDQ